MMEMRQMLPKEIVTHHENPLLGRTLADKSVSTKGRNTSNESQYLKIHHHKMSQDILITCTIITIKRM